MKFFLFPLASLFAAISVLATPIASPHSPPPGLDLSKVYIRGIKYGGTGCPQGSTSIIISPNRDTFTLIFDKYVASIGPGVDITETRKNCQISVDLQYPGGFQYSLFSADYRGFIGLDKGVSGTQKSTYYFAGRYPQPSTETTWHGPIRKDYFLHDVLPLTSIIWSPCGKSEPLNINSQIRLHSSDKSASGLMTTDSVDGKVKFIVGVQWQSCK